ncbi:MAG TPA: CDP-alcohol phosphatidyltransferase family protein, partial [Polyangiaceae bacterium]|jgi:phosphatidylglycerophosphate synthase
MTSTSLFQMMSTRSLEGGLIALLISSAVGAVLAAYAVRVARRGRIASARLDSQQGTPFLGRFPIEAFHWVARSIGTKLAQRRTSPDALTWASLALTALAAPLAAVGHFEAAGAVLLLGSSLDMLDGIVAREQGIASEAGEILDSVLDRYADALCLMGLAVFYRQSAWKLSVVLVALLGSAMVSYVRAKAEKFALSLPSTIMRRPERVAYLAMGLLFGPALSACFSSDLTSPATLVAVVVVGAFSNVAAFQLLANARGELGRRRLRTSALLASARKALESDEPWSSVRRIEPRNDVIVRDVESVALPPPLSLLRPMGGEESSGLGFLGQRTSPRRGTDAERPAIERAPASPGRLVPRRRRRKETS